MFFFPEKGNGVPEMNIIRFIKANFCKTHRMCAAKQPDALVLPRMPWYSSYYPINLYIVCAPYKPFSNWKKA